MTAVASPLLLLAMFVFLATSQAQAFNERISARYYTLGALFVCAMYGVIGLGLVCSGLGMGILACIRREAPRWLAWSAVAANALAPVAAIFFLKGQMTAWVAIFGTLIGAIAAGLAAGALSGEG